MNSDIRLSVDFFSHHKTKKVLRKLGAEGVVCLVQLFCYTGKFRPEGRLEGMDAADISDAVDWKGDAEEFVATLCEASFLERCDEGVYIIHEWEEHNPWAAGAAERSLAASKAGKASAKKRAKSANISTDVQRISTERSTGVQREGNGRSTESNAASTPSPSPSPSPLPKEKEQEIVGAAAPVSSRSRTKEDDAEAEEKFAEFWEAYPRKENRKKALAAWKKGQCGKGKFQEIMAALTEQKKNPRWLEDVKYIPHPTTWLNGERWADEISTGCAPPCAHTCSSCQYCENPLCQRKTDEERKSCTGWRAR